MSAPISAALIVKDEARFLAGCLESLQGVAGEVVVVDTGSTDETVDIARRAGARLFRFPWRGRFDDARNAALERARLPWILYIDADERVRPGTGASLAADLAVPGCLAARVRFHPRIGHTPYMETRLFRNHPRLRFRGGIHESILPALGETLALEGGFLQDTELRIDHLGYEGDLTHKHHRNLPLLREAVREDPDRYYLWCELGRAAAALGEDAEAEAAWRRAMAIVEGLAQRRAVEVLPFVDWVMYRLSRGEDPGDSLQRALVLFPDDAQLRWLLARHLVDAERYAEAIPLLEDLVARGARDRAREGVAYDERIFGSHPRESLGLCHFRLGHYAEARRWFLRAARLVPGDPTMRARAAVAGARAGPGGGVDPGTLFLRGPYRSATGYGSFTRSLGMALLRAGVPLEMGDVPRFSPDLLPPGEIPSELAALADHLDARAAVQLSLPTLAPQVPGCRSLLFTMFEGTRLPAAWAAASRGHERIVVPSESSREAWLASGLPAERIRLCPLGVDLDLYHPGVEPLALAGAQGRPVSEYGVRFLSVLAPIPRKNLPGLLRAWLRATRASDDAALILKVGRSGPAQTAALERVLGAVERMVGRPWDEAAPILWVASTLRDVEMRALFALATHYVSLSFGEGWDLPMTQAAAMGKRLLAPAHTAYRAYLDEAVARLVPATRVPALPPGDEATRAMFELAPWTTELFADAEWWAPDEEAAAAQVRAAIDGSTEPWPTARERMAGFTWDHTARRLLEIVDEVRG